MSYESIAKFTGSSATTSFNTIDFTDISQDYKHLMIISKLAMNFASKTAATTYIRFNGDSGGNYFFRYQGVADNTSTIADTALSSSTSFGQIGFGRPAADGDVEYGAFTLYIPNYSSTTASKKTFFSQSTSAVLDVNPAGENRNWNHGGYWNSSSAINRITFTSDTSPNFASLTDISIYGLRNS
jgi:hypothetical protein